MRLQLQVTVTVTVTPLFSLLFFLQQEVNAPCLCTT
jgi:hypothetical protein